MQLLNSLVCIAIGVVAVVALPTPEVPAQLEGRQAAGATCGSHRFSSSQITAAKNKGCSYLQSGTTVGSNSYPHRYNNYEGFDFNTASPWYEFPILTSGTYSGGSPGADRVIFNSNCALTALLTHTGASGNAFLECDYN